MKRFTTAALALLAAAALPAAAQPFASEECAARRARLMAEAGTGLIILFGATDAPPGSRFRQDNDFFYLTGCDDRGAVLVMLAAQGQAHLFLPEQGPREILVEGANRLGQEGVAASLRLTRVAGLSALDEFLARQMRMPRPVVYARLSMADALDSDRGEAELLAARRRRSHFNDHPGPDRARVTKLRSLFPQAELRDVAPLIDNLRLIKSPAEIEALRRNGRLSAEALRQAMLRTRPGEREWALAGAAVGWVLGHGARGPAFQPIVASGPNACTWHYERNDRVMAAGELVLMDFGADLDHLCMDISRTWPVSGSFSPEKREIYRAVLEVQKATIAACRPGRDAAEIRRVAAADLAARRVDARGLGCDIHHFVGLSVHDGAPLDAPLRAGMVLTVEPALYYPEKNIGVRIEDTILITAGGREVLSAAAPKEIEEIEALFKNRD